jgi:hypothetical protein
MRKTVNGQIKESPARFLRTLCLLACLAAPTWAEASDHHGQVLANGLPLPGATITAIQGTSKRVTVSDEQGRYVFPDLADGTWKIHIEIQCFAPIDQEISAASSSSGSTWELKILPLEQILAQTKIVKATPAPKLPESKAGSAPELPRPTEDSAQANDGLLVNGSVNNAATSQFSMAQAFGNTRKGTKSLYNGGLGFVIDNSALDARPYSLSGLDAPKSSYNRVNAIASLGGPLNIPHLMPHGPNFFLIYQWLRNNDAAIQTGLVPTAAQRSATDSAAQALLALYPLPNVAGNRSYNYQVPVLNPRIRTTCNYVSTSRSMQRTSSTDSSPCKVRVPTTPVSSASATPPIHSVRTPTSTGRIAWRPDSTAI